MTLSAETQASPGPGAPLSHEDAQFPLAAPESEVSLFASPSFCSFAKGREAVS